MRTPIAADNSRPEADDICILSQSVGISKARQGIVRRDSVLKYLLLNPEVGKIRVKT